MCVAVFQKQWEIKFTDRSSRAAGQIHLLQHQIKCLRFGALWLRSVVKHKYMWVYQQIIALTRLLKIVCNANVKAPTMIMCMQINIDNLTVMTLLNALKLILFSPSGMIIWWNCMQCVWWLCFENGKGSLKCRIWPQLWIQFGWRSVRSLFFVSLTQSDQYCGRRSNSCEFWTDRQWRDLIASWEQMS